MNISNRTKVPATVLAGVGLALAIPALPAVGLSSPPTGTVRIASEAHLADRGAVAFVAAKVACPAGQNSFLSIQLTERSGNAIASGTGSTPFVCTGNFQPVKVAVPATDKPWVKGNAFVQGLMFTCSGPTDCPATDARSIKLVH